MFLANIEGASVRGSGLGGRLNIASNYLTSSFSSGGGGGNGALRE
jgi:hypothetical protein